MCEFYYKYIKRKYDTKLLFTNTDSLVYEIETDVWFWGLSARFKVFDPVNKKVIGKMKVEFKGKIISEFVGLKSKMHYLVV